MVPQVVLGQEGTRLRKVLPKKSLEKDIKERLSGYASRFVTYNGECYSDEHMSKLVELHIKPHIDSPISIVYIKLVQTVVSNEYVVNHTLRVFFISFSRNSLVNFPMSFTFLPEYDLRNHSLNDS